MAELALAPITQGMKDGGTAIGNNFSLAEAAINAGGPVATASASVSVTGVTGTVKFQRVGSIVTARAYLHITKAFSDVFLTAAQIPTGFKNSGDVQVASLLASFSHRAMGSWVFNKNGGLALTTSNNVADDQGQFCAYWPTDDDFPN